MKLFGRPGPPISKPRNGKRVEGKAAGNVTFGLHVVPLAKTPSNFVHSQWPGILCCSKRCNIKTRRGQLSLRIILRFSLPLRNPRRNTWRRASRNFPAARIYCLVPVPCDGIRGRNIWDRFGERDRRVMRGTVRNESPGLQF